MKKGFTAGAFDMKKQGVCDKCGVNNAVYSYNDFGYEKGVYKSLKEHLACEKCGMRICSICGKEGMYLPLYSDPYIRNKSYGSSLYCHDCKLKYKK